MKNAESSIADKSSEALKEMIEEQTSRLAEAEVEEPQEEETLTEEEEPEEEKSAETSEAEEEETGEEKSSEGRKALHKIKVEGKEEEVPYEKLIEYAQKGRYLEKEMARLKQEKEKLKEAKPLPVTTDWEKLNEQFISELQKDALGTLLKWHDVLETAEREKSRAEKLADKEFEIEKRENIPHWKEIKPIYQEFRDLGYDREMAFLMAENDYFKNLYINSINKFRKEGESKAKMKQKAELPIKETKTKKVSLPSPEELKKMKSSEIAKYLKFHKVD